MNVGDLIWCVYHIYFLPVQGVIIDIINDIYDISKNEIITYNDIDYIKNNIYYEFNISKITYKKKTHFINLLKEIIKSKNYYFKNKKIIILNNFIFNTTLQNILKVIIEKNYHVIFIIITQKLNHVIEAIRSRFININKISFINYTKICIRI